MPRHHGIRRYTAAAAPRLRRGCVAMDSAQPSGGPRTAGDTASLHSGDDDQRRSRTRHRRRLAQGRGGSRHGGRSAASAGVPRDGRGRSRRRRCAHPRDRRARASRSLSAGRHGDRRGRLRLRRCRPTTTSSARAGSPTSPTHSRSRGILAELGLDPVAVTGRAPARHPRGHRVLARRHRGALRARTSARLVDGVTKLSKFSTLTHEQQQAENIRKMFLAMAEDIRVVLIKLADRLHNMRTLGALPPDKQQRIARQTAEIYAPLAERPGHLADQVGARGPLLQGARARMAYRELARQLESHRKAREAYVQRARTSCRGALEAADIEAELSGRPKHIYSIHKKMRARAPSSARSTTSTPCACWSRTSATATRRSASSTRSGGPSPGSSTTTSRCPRTTCTRASTPRSWRSTASRSRSRSGPTTCTVSARSASPLTGATRRARAATAPTTPSSPGSASSWSGSATSRDATEFVEGLKLDIFQDQVFVFTPQGRRQGPAGGRHAARLRLPHPHRRRPRLHRRQGEQPPRAARLPAEERRHRRDRDDARARTARRATGSPS